MQTKEGLSNAIPVAAWVSGRNIMLDISSEAERDLFFLILKSSGCNAHAAISGGRAIITLTPSE